MSIYVRTENPKGLINKIKQAIDNNSIDTWAYDSEGDFTHNVDQWRYSAWMRPHIESGRIIFAILCRKDKNLSMVEYAVYHGRFVEMLLRHFDKDCQSIDVSPLGTSYDVINAQLD